MPMRAPRPCSKPGCRELVRGPGTRCAAHYEPPAERATSTERGYDNRWRVESRAFLRERPFCCACEAEGIFLVEATVVDHNVPHKGDQVLFWDRSNWRPKCKHHHDVGTAKYDGGFGNPVRPKPTTEA